MAQLWTDDTARGYRVGSEYEAEPMRQPTPILMPVLRLSPAVERENNDRLKLVAWICGAIHEARPVLTTQSDVWNFAYGLFRERLDDGIPLSGDELQRLAVAVKAIWRGLVSVRESGVHLHLVRGGAFAAATPKEAA